MSKHVAYSVVQYQIMFYHFYASRRQHLKSHRSSVIHRYWSIEDVGIVVGSRLAC
jgi:hypothetical protein